MPVDDATLRVVADRLARGAGEYGLAPVAGVTVTLRRLAGASTYPIYLAEFRSNTAVVHRLVVKFAPIFGAHREGRAEFENLRTMAARLGPASPLHVPRPFHYWDDVNALVTEHCPGIQFSQRILSSAQWFAPAARREALARTARQCGEWLRIYHDASSRGEGPAIDDRFVGIMQRDLSRMPERGALHGLRGPIEAALETIERTLRPTSVPVAVRHGDFSPDNVHLAGDGICVFDLSHDVPAPVHSDITFFLVTLDTMNPYPRYPGFDRRAARTLAAPFLEGYFGADRARRERAESAVLGAYTLKNLLTRCLRQRGVAAKAGPLAVAAFDRLWVAGMYRGLIERAIRRATAAG